MTVCFCIFQQLKSINNPYKQKKYMDISIVATICICFIYFYVSAVVFNMECIIMN